MQTGRHLSRRELLARAALGSASALAAVARDSPAVGAGGPGDDPSDRQAVVDPTPAQTIEGFGVAGAWWPNDLIRFDPSVQAMVAERLFGAGGIALSAYRYNIGSGGVGVEHQVRAPEGFLIAPGEYDWLRDPGGRRFLSLAADHGVPVLIGFANSAPPVWTTTGTSCGGLLQPGAEAAFAAYLTDVVEHFHAAEGVTLSYVSSMNEPAYRFEGCGQEGMAVPAPQRATLIQALGRTLAARAPYARVIADESSRVRQHFLAEVPQWLGVGDTAEHVAALAHHLYDFPDAATLREARALGERYGKPLWSTEICCFDTRTGAWGPQYDPTIRGALVMANLIWQGMTEANDAAFHWWVALSSELGCDPLAHPGCEREPNDDGWNDGLLYYDPNYAENGNQTIYLTKRYWALGNFSRYVRPGARRHDVLGGPDPLRLLAFATDGGWAVVVVNNAPAGRPPAEVELRLPPEKGRRLIAEAAIETSAARDLAPVSPPRVETSGLLRARVPAESITTYVLRREAAR
jgi:O-glycosyl hydrolase